jgi:hypothetical protein
MFKYKLHYNKMELKDIHESDKVKEEKQVESESESESESSYCSGCMYPFCHICHKETFTCANICNKYNDLVQKPFSNPSYGLCENCNMNFCHGCGHLDQSSHLYCNNCADWSSEDSF